MACTNGVSIDSSSVHTLNADLPLDLYQQKLWFNTNIENNRVPNDNLDLNLDIRLFECDINFHWESLDAGLTPSRKISNFFWLTLPWQKLFNNFGPIRIMDFGCSTGNYALNFMKWTDVPFEYHGFDVRWGSLWEERSSEFQNLKFTQYKGKFGRQHMKDEFNFFMSQSAMEHVVQDLSYFRLIANYSSEIQKPNIQIHLVPSAACLELYGLHGVRQYTPRTISKISRLFPNAICTLFSLGGAACNNLHMQAITLPAHNNGADWRTTNLDDYEDLLEKSILIDMTSKSFEASFYALVIESGVSSSIFSI